MSVSSKPKTPARTRAVTTRAPVKRIPVKSSVPKAAGSEHVPPVQDAAVLDPGAAQCEPAVLSSEGEVVRKAVLELQQRLEAREQTQREQDLVDGQAGVQLTCWPDPVRVAPVGLMRTALFTASQERKYYRDYTVLTATQDVEIAYRGEQLTQMDLSVWLQDLHLARMQPLGTWIEYTPLQFLKALDKTGGQSNYDRLWECQERMQHASIRVSTKRYQYTGSLIMEAVRDRFGSGNTALLLSPRLSAMFDPSDAWHQWEQRQALKRDYLAQRLMALWATFAAPAPYTTERLFALAGLYDKSPRSRRQKLKRACETLRAAGFLREYHFNTASDTLIVQRAGTKLIE